MKFFAHIKDSTKIDQAYTAIRALRIAGHISHEMFKLAHAEYTDGLDLVDDCEPAPSCPGHEWNENDYCSNCGADGRA